MWVNFAACACHHQLHRLRADKVTNILNINNWYNNVNTTNKNRNNSGGRIKLEVINYSFFYSGVTVLPSCSLNLGIAVQKVPAMHRIKKKMNYVEELFVLILFYCRHYCCLNSLNYLWTWKTMAMIVAVSIVVCCKYILIRCNVFIRVDYPGKLRGNVPDFP